MMRGGNHFKYKLYFVYPNTPKSLPLVNYGRQGNIAFFYVSDFNEEVWLRLKKLAYSEQVHPCPWKKITLQYKVFESVNDQWVEKKLSDFGIEE